MLFILLCWLLIIAVIRFYFGSGLFWSNIFGDEETESVLLYAEYTELELDDICIIVIIYLRPIYTTHLSKH